ncbi:MAG: choice-of-anchor H family protein, partial [Kangiellaceae bacterium]|nr:choice-of-anchor H family protein [Kangiellaceae bacterium]
STAESSGSFQGRKKDKTSAAGNIILSRRTSEIQERTTTKSLVQNVEQYGTLGAKPSRRRNVNVRSSSPQSSSQAFGFSIYDADVFLNVDADADGYYSDFTLEFDADYDEGTTEVFAVIYTSENGGEWEELFVTNAFVISFDSVDDTQSISTALNFGFPTGDYDILIDLFENGVAGIVATIDPSSDADLFALPLEDAEHDLRTNISEISFVASTLSADFDRDGFYTELTLEYDIATDYSGDAVYAEIVITDTFDGSRQFLNSDNFILGNQTEFIDLTFNAGYPAGWYDIQSNLINVFTNEIIADAAR